MVRGESNLGEVNSLEEDRPSPVMTQRNFEKPVDLEFEEFGAMRWIRVQAYLRDIMGSVPDHTIKRVLHCIKASRNLFASGGSCLQFAK